jgi:superfamily II RNA helicase
MVLYIKNKKYEETDPIITTPFNEFPHPLSNFQKYAIQHIVAGDHVFCNVPTGSGKTLPALFAISLFVGKRDKKVVYCSPIKSLSNQKYHEFKEKFPSHSVGLVTGDIKMNQNADIIVCTTEILMNFLMKQDGTLPTAETPLLLNLNDIAMIILDECHYVFDKERGYVWETVIMKTPPEVQLLLLSGSFRDPMKFCEWIDNRTFPHQSNHSPLTNGDINGTTNEELIAPKSNHSPLTNEASGDTRKRGCVCIVDTHRVVPLTHYSYLTANEGFFKKFKNPETKKELRDATNCIMVLQDAKGVYEDATYNKITRTLETFRSVNQYTNRKFVLNNVTEYVKSNEMLPAIFFVFSRKLCEQFAEDITVNVLEDDSKTPYTIARDYEQFIRKKLPNYAEYLQLPEYIKIIRLLEKGIAFHHSGMLPVLRELVEFAISENRVKLLFATESFGIGLNCAIKTTIFTQLKKHDGTEPRFLYSHEYLQMAGRAGRRGIDTKGYVIHLNNMFNEQPTLLEYKTMLKCEAPKMKSQYYISYNTIMGFGDTGTTTTNAMKSVMEYELEEKIAEQKKTLQLLRQQLEMMERNVLMCKTPRPIIHEYCDAIAIQGSVTPHHNKKQKATERIIQNLQETYYNIVGDARTVTTFNQMKREYIKEEDYLTHLENYIKTQVTSIQNIMKSQGYEVGSDKLRIATNIHEIHPLVITDYITTHRDILNHGDDTDMDTIISLLSLWADIRMRTGDDTPITEEPPEFVNEIRELYKKYEELEIKHNVDYRRSDTGTVNEQYLGAVFVKWVNTCDTIEQCRVFIQEELNTRGITLGDFTKGCLKMVAISNELVMSLGTINDQLLLAQKFTKVERALCKFIVTSQSLYV